MLFNKDGKITQKWPECHEKFKREELKTRWFLLSLHIFRKTLKQIAHY